MPRAALIMPGPQAVTGFQTTPASGYGIGEIRGRAFGPSSRPFFQGNVWVQAAQSPNYCLKNIVIRNAELCLGLRSLSP